jgi:probable HAF family extracellular repeat protein
MTRVKRQGRKETKMKLTILTRITGTALLVVLALPAQIMAQDQQAHKREHFAHYRVTDLGTLGGTYSYAFGLNNAGEVAGGSASPNQTDGISQTAFLWTKQTGMRDLGTLGGFNTILNSAATGVNASGEVALISETFTTDPNGEDFCGFGTHRQCLAAIGKDGAMAALPGLGGNNSQAYWINNRGQVAGFAENTNPEHPEGFCLMPFQRLDFEAVIWEPNGETRELPPLPGDTVAFAWDINDHGQTVGASGSCSNVSVPPSPPAGPTAPHAVLWESDGSPINLGNLGGAEEIANIAGGINNRGEVVGTSQSSKDGNVHAFLWTKETGMQDLGALPGAIATVAPCCHTINNRGEVVGFSVDATFNTRALVWKDKVLIDLNRLIPRHSPWYLQAAESINDAGQIAGYGTINGETHAFLATPCHRHDDRQCCDGHDR